MNIREILDYEIRSSWWAGLLPFNDLSARYFAWKVRRKYKRYTASVKIAEELSKKYLIP